MNRSVALLTPLAVLLLAGCSPSKEKCFSPNIECGGKCVDGSRDPGNCGGCGVTCSAGETCCGSCVDLKTSISNCGACGARCPTGGSCSSSTCSCPPTTPTVCGANPGKCVDLDTDPVFCGTCSQACWSPLLASTVDATCSAGACACSGSGTSCPGESPQCRNTQTDATACGSCGNDCSTTLPRATCSGGTCVCGAVAFPDDCGALPGGAGCVNKATDPANCGACGHVCSGSTPSCSNGLCCASGSTNCSGTCVDTRTSNANCGACGHVCPGGQACSGGTCGCPASAPRTCGGNCCAGTACCSGGTTCQTQHDNGLGGHFFDCNPLYTPATATLQAATDAADSWGVGTTIPGMCDGTCIARQTPTACAIWCFNLSPTLSGRVTSGPTISCPSLCLNFAGATPTWQ